jgi:hypothetical protein
LRQFVLHLPDREPGTLGNLAISHGVEPGEDDFTLQPGQLADRPLEPLHGYGIGFTGHHGPERVK